MDEVAETAYEKSVETVMQTVQEEVGNEDFEIITDHRNAILSNPAYSENAKKFAGNIFNNLMDRFKGMTRHISERLAAIFRSPEKKEEIQQPIRRSIRELLARNRAEADAANAERQARQDRTRKKNNRISGFEMCPSLTGSNDEDRHFFHGRNRKKVMLLELYSQIKEQVSTRGVAEHYDHKVKRNGMMLCPFHEDKILSMKVDKNFICFGCQEKGDVIRFAAKLFGLPPCDAAGRLIEDMALTVTAESRQEVQLGIRQKARYKLTEKQLFDQAVDRVYNVCRDYYRLLNE